MLERKLPDPATTERAFDLRGALGLRTPSGWHRSGEDNLAWYENLPPRPQLHPILCLHNLASGSREFTPLLRHRIPGTRLILLDWPAHGRSESTKPAPSASQFSFDRAAEILDSFLAGHNLVRPTIVASGYGAAVALHYASTRSQRLRGVALINPTSLNPTGLLSKSASNLSEPAARRSLFHNCRQPMPHSRRQALRLAAIRPAFRESLAEAQRVAGLQSQRLRTLLARLETPALLALSPMSRSHQRSWLRLIDEVLAAAPQHRIAIFKGGFHPAWDEPARFAQTLAAFVQAQLPLSRHYHAWQLTAADYPARSLNLWRCAHPECRAEQILKEGEDPNQSLVHQLKTQN